MLPTWLQTAPTGPTSGAELVELVEHLTNWFFVGFLVLAVVFILWAGWWFISSEAEPTRVTAARNRLFWAAIAVGAAVLARAVPAAIRSVIGG